MTEKMRLPDLRDQCPVQVQLMTRLEWECKANVHRCTVEVHLTPANDIDFYRILGSVEARSNSPGSGGEVEGHEVHVRGKPEFVGAHR